MVYAEISVNSPGARRRAFTYSIPQGLDIKVGQAVRVPFGDKVLQGVVLELTSVPAVVETREIAGVIDPVPLLSPAQVSLARWISSSYLAPLFESAALMLPPGFKQRLITTFSRREADPETEVQLTGEQQEVLEAVPPDGEVPLSVLEKRFGQRVAGKVLPLLVNRRLLVKSYHLAGPQIRPKMVRYLRLAVDAGRAVEVLDSLGSRASKRADILRYLLDNPGLNPLSAVKAGTDCSLATIKALREKGLISVEDVRVDRDPLPVRSIKLSFPLSLTPAQSSALNAIRAGLTGKLSAHSRPPVFLLHGVTGSGKTEVYIRALEEAVKLGKQGIMLVPEISMTPQVIERFVSRFPGRVAVLHSSLTLGEQYDEWWRIKKGEFDVVIGPRSAIFAPLPDPGLIVIDEEHEWTYKQEEHPPCYHTREVALKLAELTGASVVLGSATPDVESYFKARNGEYRLLELRERVTPAGVAHLPEVEIVDLKEELKAGNRSLFSRSLRSSMESALQERQQIILFLNRRGSASVVECRSCGHVIRCKRCEVPLSYHFKEDILLCHLCNYRIRTPRVCPRCRSQRIKYLGVGTEKLEQETAAVFPQARIQRWDSDIVKGLNQANQKIFDQVKKGKTDILIGTQMIAKGLDLPGVTLVGVVSADIALNLPDFRAGERTYQLLSQVAGRAGRGTAAGKVIIQTYSPGNYAVQAAAKHDYRAFFEKEMEYRRQLRNPPYSRLARLTFSHFNDQRCREESTRMHKLLTQEKEARGLGDVSLLGPAPAFVPRLRSRFRWQIVLRASNPAAFLSEIDFPAGWTIDIDPVGPS